MSIDLNLRIRDDYGNVVLSDESVIELLYSGEFEPSDILVDSTSDTRLYNNWAKIFDLTSLQIYTQPTETIEEFDKNNQAIWNIPESYQNIDLTEYLLKKM
ncbi:MAG: hypothetical protein HC836_30340 [Richelia sp. RM2_1_2]|nr:hypothetical protein [Richelia sp. RM2_1_2]